MLLEKNQWTKTPQSTNYPSTKTQLLAKQQNPPRYAVAYHAPSQDQLDKKDYWTFDYLVYKNNRQN